MGPSPSGAPLAFGQASLSGNETPHRRAASTIQRVLTTTRAFVESPRRRRIGAQRDVLGECPLWDERTQRLWWIDSRAHALSLVLFFLASGEREPLAAPRFIRRAGPRDLVRHDREPADQRRCARGNAAGGALLVIDDVGVRGLPESRFILNPAQ